LLPSNNQRYPLKNLRKEKPMNYNSPTKIAVALTATLAISACSSSNYAPSSSSVTNPNTAMVDPDQIFSDVNELDYTPPKVAYRIGSGDLLEIKVFQVEELSQTVRVDPRGNISLPLIGTIPVEGLSQVELEKKLETMLGAKYLQDPQITVFIKEFTNQRITVEGEVKTSGVFPIQGDMTVLQAIALAGGMSNLADPAKTVLFRKSGDTMKAYNIDVNAIRDGKMRDPYVRNDDRVVVHRSDSRFWIREVGTLLNPFRIF